MPIESSVTQLSDLNTSYPANADDLNVGARHLRNVKTAAVSLTASGGSNQIGFLQSGTGATARTLQAKSRDIISAKDFGAVGNGATNDTAAIQACIAAHGGGAIYFPKGTYLINDTLDVQVDATRLYGGGPNVSIIVQSAVDVDTVKFSPTTAGSSADFLNSVSINGLGIVHNATVYASHTEGAGIRFVQCNGYKLNDVKVNNAFEGITIEGGQLGSLKNFEIYATAGAFAGDETALLHLRQAAIGGGSYAECFTVQVDDFRMSATLLRGTCIRIASADGANFSNGYMGYGEDSLLRVTTDRDDSYVAAVSFTNVYFDCVGALKTKNGVVIADDGFNSIIYGLKIGSGCTIGNGDESGIVCTKAETMDLSIDGALILNMGLWGITVDGSTTYTDLHIVNTQIQNCGDGTSGGVRANTGRSLNISSNTFSATANLCVQLAGTWSQGTVCGNTNSTNIADLDNQATFTKALTVAGNSSTYATAGQYSWRGNKIGNIAVDDETTLDWYEEDPTFTPSITLGGAAVGVTYGSPRTGTFTRIGNRVFFDLTITLTSKGSSTGALRITGLPYAAGAGATYVTPVECRLNNITAGVGDQLVKAFVEGGGTTIRIDKIASGGTAVTELADTDLSNTSSIAVAGHYYV